MSNRQWRVTATFPGMEDVTVSVTAPNLTGGIRKGALEIKRSPEVRGKRLRGGLFAVSELTRLAEIPEEVNDEQLALAEPAQVEAEPAPQESQEPQVVEPEVPLPEGE